MMQATRYSSLVNEGNEGNGALAWSQSDECGSEVGKAVIACVL